MMSEPTFDSPDASRPDPTTSVVDRIERDDEDRLVAHLVDWDEPVVDVRVARYFPWSMPEVCLSVRDAEGCEVAMLKSLDDLDDASRAVVEAELSDKVFNPKILRVRKYTREFGISSIDAETDRGDVIFQFAGRDDVRILSATRALFRDVDGNTYELVDLTQLDAASQRHLRPFF